MCKPQYKFWATLFDAFEYYKNSESEDAFQSLLNSINKVEFSSEPADKGTAFNELIDKALADPIQMDNCIKNGQKEIEYHYTNRVGLAYKFNFKTELVKSLFDYFQGAVSQLYVESTINVNGVDVLLYGYLDYNIMDCCHDLKTTSNYTFPKYLVGFQKHIYPICLNAKGIECNRFEYTVTDFSNIYTEVYEYNAEKSLKSVQVQAQEIIDFIENPNIRPLITNTKIFGGE